MTLVILSGGIVALLILLLWAWRLASWRAREALKINDSLRSSEQRLQFALDSTGDGLWDWNAKTNTIFYSSRWSALLGYSDNELGDNHDEWQSRIHPDDREQVYADLQQHFGGIVDVYENEHRIRCKDGSYIWILDRGKVIERDAEGKPQRVIGTFTDISEQRKIQETLRLQSRAMEASVSGIVISDAKQADLPIVYCNSAFEQMTGYDREVVMGRNCRFLQGVDKEQAGLDDIRKALHQGCAATALLRNYRKDGSLFWNELSISPVHDKNGVISHFIGITHDVTARIKAEEELRYEHEFASAAINALPGIFFVINKHQRIVRLNDNVALITGFSQAELFGMGTLDYFHEEDKALVAEKISECFQQGHVECEANLITKSGECLPFYFQAQLRVLGGREYLVGTGTDVSRLKQIQKALTHSQTLLNSIVEHIPAMVFLKRASDLSYVLLNKAGEEILEYRRDEVLDKTDQELFTPQQAREMVAVDQEVLSTKRAKILPETQFNSRSGWRRSLYTIKTALCDEQGNPTYLLGISIDITDRIHAERKSQISEERLKEAQRIAHLGNWSWDMRTGLVYWSEEIFQMFGVDQATYGPSYDNFYAAVHPDDIVLVKRSEQKALQEGVPHSVDHRIVRPDGEVRWVHEEARASQNAEGKIERLAGTVQDITERKLIEQAVQTSETRLRTILESAVDGIITIDSAGTIDSVNPSAEKIFGYHAAELNGRNISMLMPEPYRSAHDGYIQRYLTSGNAHIIGIGREMIGQRKDGSTFPLDLAVSETVLNGRRIITGIVRDITMRKHVEQELVQAKETAEQANRAKSEFLSNMSHELRTPMNAILGFAQLLDAADPPLVAAQQQDVKEILRAGQHLLELINELLDLARIEAGRMDISIEPVFVRSILDQCMQMVEPLLLRNQVSLQLIEKDTTDCVVMADRIRLRQVLLNLLSNAIKYNVPGGCVTVSCSRKPNAHMRIEVKDTGIGIAPEKRAELFNAFSRLGAEESAIEGTGIGLAISRRLVELMNGEVGVESQPGAGSIFWLLLPSGRVAEQSLAPALRMTAPGKPLTGNAGYTVLYIEDNPANLRFMTHLLRRRSNLNLLTATDPAAGLRLAEEHRPDLILLDLHLPGMDGFEVFHHLQNSTQTRDIPVIAVSANAMPNDIERALNAGFKEYCTKPLDIGKFMHTVDSILRPELRLQ